MLAAAYIGVLLIDKVSADRVWRQWNSVHYCDLDTLLAWVAIAISAKGHRLPAWPATDSSRAPQELSAPICDLQRRRTCAAQNMPQERTTSRFDIAQAIVLVMQTSIRTAMTWLSIASRTAIATWNDLELRNPSGSACWPRISQDYDVNSTCFDSLQSWRSRQSLVTRLGRH